MNPPAEKLNLNKLGLLVSIAGGIIVLAQTFLVVPYRLEVAENHIVALEKEVRISRELLVRIDENVKALKEAIK